VLIKISITLVLNSTLQLHMSLPMQLLRMKLIRPSCLQIQRPSVLLLLFVQRHPTVNTTLMLWVLANSARKLRAQSRISPIRLAQLRIQVVNLIVLLVASTCSHLANARNAVFLSSNTPNKTVFLSLPLQRRLKTTLKLPLIITCEK